MPKGEVVPEQRNVTVVVSLIAHTKQAVVVQISWQKRLSGHIDEVILNV